MGSKLSPFSHEKRWSWSLNTLHVNYVPRSLSKRNIFLTARNPIGAPALSWGRQWRSCAVTRLSCRLLNNPLVFFRTNKRVVKGFISTNSSHFTVLFALSLFVSFFLWGSVNIFEFEARCCFLVSKFVFCSDRNSCNCKCKKFATLRWRCLKLVKFPTQLWNVYNSMYS